MINLKKILVPTDFSEFSKPAVDYASALAAKFDSELHLVHVVDDPIVHVHDPTMISLGALYDKQDERHEIARTELRKLADSWEHESDTVCETRQGAAYVEIVRYAKDNQIDLIVIGTHGRSGLMHVLIGSVAERVVRKAPCPVLTVRPEGHQFVMP